MKKGLVLFYFFIQIHISLLFAQSHSALIFYSERTPTITNFYTLYVNDTLGYWQLYESKIKDTFYNAHVGDYYKQIHTYEIFKVETPEYSSYPYKKFVYKDKKNKKLYFIKHRYREKDLYVIDSLFPMKWEPIAERRFILGYECMGAKTHFRGRTYKVFYAPQLAWRDGPWKFGGLPGLILEVEEPEFHFKAEKIILNVKDKPSLPPINKYKWIEWPDYVQFIRKYYDRSIAERIAEKIRENEDYESGFRIIDKEIIHRVYSPMGVIIPGATELRKKRQEERQKRRKKRRKHKSG